jgi:carboxymethylenebutenolidase
MPAMETELTASDGHRLAAYENHPPGSERSIVVIQEIFGVNAHIRSVVDRYAALGYRAVAPALFDRIEPGVELNYTDDLPRGIELLMATGDDNALTDVAAAVDYLSGSGPIGVVGYCWGGLLAWLSACDLGIDAAVGYYGGRIAQYPDKVPQKPVMLHFGGADEAIPMSQVDEIRAAHPDVPIHVYPTGHGFNCDVRDSHNPECAALALERTLAFFDENLA